MSSRKRFAKRTLYFSATCLVATLAGCGSKQSSGDRALEPAAGTNQGVTAIDQVSDDMSPATVALGQRIFRFETFGDEQFWTDKLKMHEVVAKAVSPKTALSVGLKVDAEAIDPWARRSDHHEELRAHRSTPGWRRLAQSRVDDRGSAAFDGGT